MGEFRVGIFPARLELLQPDCIGPITVDFVRGHVNERRFRTKLASTLHQIQCADRVDVEVVEGNARGQIVRRLCGSMDDDGGFEILD